jgi:hypothetical protein
MNIIESMTKQDKCVIYSLGVFDDSSWEKEMIDRTSCQVYAFDASVDGIAGGKSLVVAVPFSHLAIILPLLP